jgi:hypothetical protein
VVPGGETWPRAAHARHSRQGIAAGVVRCPSIIAPRLRARGCPRV